MPSFQWVTQYTRFHPKLHPYCVFSSHFSILTAVPFIKQILENIGAGDEPVWQSGKHVAGRPSKKDMEIHEEPDFSYDGSPKTTHRYRLLFRKCRMRVNEACHENALMLDFRNSKTLFFQKSAQKSPRFFPVGWKILILNCSIWTQNKPLQIDITALMIWPLHQETCPATSYVPGVSSLSSHPGSRKTAEHPNGTVHRYVYRPSFTSQAILYVPAADL